MKLAFNEFGDIRLSEVGDLEIVSKMDAELSRFLMFFDTVRGSYFYDDNYGNNSLEILGKVGIEPEDMQLFNESLNEHLLSSNILPLSQLGKFSCITRIFVTRFLAVSCFIAITRVLKSVLKIIAHKV